MDYEYKFSEEEKNVLYKELKKLINSDEYKLLRKEYNNLITQISKNVINFNLQEPISIVYLLNKSIKNHFNNVNYDDSLDLDILYKLWGSRVTTNAYSERHIVSFINDILIRSGFISCKIIANRQCFNLKNMSDYKNCYKYPNCILLCIIVNDKKIFFDIENNTILSYNKFLSGLNYSCYKSVEDNRHLYFINTSIVNNLEINDDHLFCLNDYSFSDEFLFKDYYSKLFLEDYLEFLNDYKENLLDFEDINLKNISKLNKELSEKQNDIYKRVKKYDR